MDGLRGRGQVGHALREAARLGPGAPVLHLGVHGGPRDLLRTRVGGHHAREWAGQEHRQLPRATARIPREPLRGREPGQEVDEPGRVRRAMRRVGGRHIGKVILEAP